MAEEAFTLDKLRAMHHEMIREIPPLPFLASSMLFSADHAMKFTLKGRDYLGAHPDFWEKVPKRVLNPERTFTALGLEVVDLDLSVNRQRRADFYTAMAQAMQTERTETNTLPATPDAET